MFKEKVCVITGGANGIGKAITEEFRRNNGSSGKSSIKEKK